MMSTRSIQIVVAIGAIGLGVFLYFMPKQSASEREKIENFEVTEVSDVQMAAEKVLNGANPMEGLGYYSRAKNMHATAKHVQLELKGKFPDNALALQGLKGVGPYTSAAIASIAFNEPVAAIDGNVLRVYSRYFSVDHPINKPNGKGIIERLAQEHLDTKTPGDFNQALMDFGSLICKPKKPICSSCPIAKNCLAFLRNQVDILPIKEGKTKVKSLFIDYLVFIHNGKVMTRRRDDKSIWKNLHDFPSTESPVETKQGTPPEILVQWEPQIESINQSATIKHQLSHRAITATFWEVRLNKPILFDASQDLSWTDQSEIDKLPVPRLIEKFWNIYIGGLK